GIATRVDPDSSSRSRRSAASAKISRVHKRGTGGIELRHESIGEAGFSRLVSIHRRKVGRSGLTCRIGIADRIYVNAGPDVVTIASQVRRVHKAGTGRI